MCKVVKKVCFKWRTLLIFGIFLLIGFFVLPLSFAVLSPLKSIEIKSLKLNYDNDNPGSWKIEKSARWTGKGEAEIAFKLNTNVIPRSTAVDVLFVIDVSSSMYGEDLDRVKADVTALLNHLYEDTRNRAGLIIFDGNSKIISNFTYDGVSLKEKINDLETGDITNYYAALKDVDTVLKTYTKEKNKECIVLFLTDGYPNDDTPNEVGQYKYLKRQYPYVTINGVQYEMGEEISDSLKSVSDFQYAASLKTLNNILFAASDLSVVYDNFIVEDYVDTDYFYVASENDIKIDYGSVKLDKSNQKISWSFNRLKSGQNPIMKIKVKLKEELIGKGGVYSTNKEESVLSKINDVSEEIVSNDTPILADNYKVIYDGNAPNNCTLSNVPISRNRSVYDVVEVSDNVPKCDGYVFKEWDMVTKNIEKLNDDYFIMPESDVIIRAKWSKIDFKKSMDGKVEDGITLYEQIRNEYDAGCGYVKKYNGNIDTFIGDKDVFYYNGNTAKHNVIFANYCWNIVRTTDTGGVKLLYSGVPSSDLKCNNKEGALSLTASQINSTNASVKFNSDATSLASAGYMYNISYKMEYKKTSTIASGTLYGSGFTYDNGTYTLTETQSYLNSTHHYTCFNRTGSCSTVSFVTYNHAEYTGKYFEYHYINLENGKSIDDAVREMLYAPDVNKYDSTVKAAIDYWYSNNMIDYTKYLEDTVWCNDRSIKDLKGWAPDGYLGYKKDGAYYTNDAGFLFRPSYLADDLTCLNVIDRFTVNKENGNGALKYPVGLLTYSEDVLSRKEATGTPFSSETFWTMSPQNQTNTNNVSISYTGKYASSTYFGSYYLRPSISLKPDIHYIDGDGSANKPYIVLDD